MIEAVQFSVRVSVKDRDPQVLENTLGAKRPFLSQEYVASQDYGQPYSWQWRRVGPVLKLDGTPRADGRLEYTLVTEVPAYAGVELAIVISNRAEEVKAKIDAWVEAAQRHLEIPAE